MKVKNSKSRATLISGAIGAMLAVSAQVNAAPVVCAEQERCFGITRSGLNDCGTATTACRGSAKKDGQSDAWIYVPKGSCEKIAGGMLEKKKK